MASTPSYPSLVMVIRHGEKPGAAGNDKGGGKHLSVRGSARAAALPSLFVPGPKPAAGAEQLCCQFSARAKRQVLGTYHFGTVKAPASRFPTPNYLFATKSSGASWRPVETITPLAQALQRVNDPAINPTINDHFTNKKADIDALAAALLATPGTYGGKTVLICWHHGTIPHLVEKLGVPHGELKGWKPFPASVFDVVMLITWSGSQAALTVDHQKLLFGDTP